MLTMGQPMTLGKKMQVQLEGVQTTHRHPVNQMHQQLNPIGASLHQQQGVTKVKLADAGSLFEETVCQSFTFQFSLVRLLKLD
jgi:hypothetical protein